MSRSVTINGREYLSAGDVGKHFGYTRDYLLMLSREGKIDGKKIGHRWYVNMSSAESFFRAAHAERLERREALREERKEELRKSSVSVLHTGHKKSYVAEYIGVAVLGVSLIVLTGFISLPSVQHASLANAHASLFEKVTFVLEAFFGREVSPHEDVLTDAGSHSVESETGSTSSGGERIVYTSLVVGPDEVMTTSTVESIRSSFSDDVSVSIDPHHPDTGIIVPHFKNRDGEAYRFLMVPVRGGNTE